jgi:hypothetical protein
MAIPWMVVLQNIPWREVISNAPRVADEAKKLWTTLSRDRSYEAKTQPSTATTFSSADARNSGVMHSKIFALEAQVADLHAQMLESTKLIDVLASQNAELVKHIEKNRARIKLLSIVLCAMLVAFLVFIWRTL